MLIYYCYYDITKQHITIHNITMNKLDSIHNVEMNKLDSIHTEILHRTHLDTMYWYHLESCDFKANQWYKPYNTKENDSINYNKFRSGSRNSK